MRPPAALHVAFLLAFALATAGCLEGEEAAGPPAPPGAEGDDGRTARGADRGDDEEDEPAPVELGGLAGGTTAPGRYPFTVTVPPGGAKEVTWSLVITPIATPSESIEGPGCEPTGGITYVGSSSETYGRCGKLAEGDHEFVVVLTGPAPETFSARVLGVVVPAGNTTATPGSSSSQTSSNATER